MQDVPPATQAGLPGHVSTGRAREVSWSELESFQQCPRKYLWRHREKRKGVHRHGPASFVGRVIHETLADYARLPASARTFDRANQLFRSRWAGHVDRSLSFEGRDEEAQHGRDATEALKWAVEQEDLAAQAFAVESKCIAPLDDGLLLAGKLDRVDRLPDGSLLVTDYKTGKVPNAWRMPDAERQLQIYALLARHQFGAGSSPVAAQFVYLEYRHRHRVEPAPQDLDTLAEDVRHAVMVIDSECDFLPSIGPLCGWCDYLSMCDAGKAWQQERDRRASEAQDA